MRKDNIINRLKQELVANRVLRYDNSNYKKYYSSLSWGQNHGNQAARDILVFCHVVEKGLSHKVIKPLFGYERVVLISKKLKEYLEKGGQDEFIIGMAISTLTKYNSINLALGTSKDKLIDIPTVNCHRSIEIGVKTLSETEYFRYSSIQFSQLCKARHSIRLYDCESERITTDEIIKALEVAQLAPSACNRQAVRVKIVTEKRKIAQISEIQGGSKGFGENAGAMLIITSDISFYEPEERRIPMLDCGIFIMNLLYALYEKRIGSCILNGSFSKQREKRMREIVAIPQNEMYASVIALSKVPKDETIIVANSPRRSIYDIVTIL